LSAWDRSWPWLVSLGISIGLGVVVSLSVVVWHLSFLLTVAFAGVGQAVHPVPSLTPWLLTGLLLTTVGVAIGAATAAGAWAAVRWDLPRALFAVSAGPTVAFLATCGAILAAGDGRAWLWPVGDVLALVPIELFGYAVLMLGPAGAGAWVVIVLSRRHGGAKLRAAECA
jgi:hypothetical protein